MMCLFKKDKNKNLTYLALKAKNGFSIIKSCPLAKIF